MKRWMCALAIGAVLSFSFGIVAWGQDSKSLPAPLFTAGETIGVVWDCLPVALVPLGGEPCYAEILTVLVVRPDGWLQVTTSDGSRWVINPARAAGFQRAPITAVALGGP